MNRREQTLLDDAAAVGEVAARLGALPNDELPSALAAARDASAAGRRDAAVDARLIVALSDAMRRIAPITLDDLRRGWRPYSGHDGYRWGTFVFFLISVAVMFACAFTTQVYERARTMYATTLELQDARGAEQAMRLFGMLKRNQDDIKAALQTGKKEFLYETFGKSLFDLKAMYLKSLSYLDMSSGVLNDLEMIASPSVAWRRLRNPGNPSGVDVVQQRLSQPGYGQMPPVAEERQMRQLASAGLDATIDLKDPDAQRLLETYLSQLGKFNQSIKLDLDPLQPYDYFSNLFRLRNGIGFVGLWVLPALYGMLGAIIFNMRRLLNPLLPDYAAVQVVFRVLLGGFSGIIIVWFFTPASQKASQGEFATLTAFGAAFLVGFSADVFFHALDRLVEYLTGAVGGPKARAAAPA